MATPNRTHPKLLAQGITGADLTLPLFDGTSQNPFDHLIDVDTPSMERYPDVRVYSHMVGQVSEGYKAVDIPSDIEERKLFDDQYVKRGREFLKNCKAKGAGAWISPKRDILAKNEPGGKYYRLPVMGIVNDILEETTEPLEDEGYYWVGNVSEDGTYHEFDSLGVFFTNIRVPILWAECYQEGVGPGTVGWDISFDRVYGTQDSPAYLLSQMDVGWDEMIRNALICSTGGFDPGSSSGSPCLRVEAERILRRYWPNLKRPWFPGDTKFEGPGILELSGHTVDEFLGRTKPK